MNGIDQHGHQIIRRSRIFHGLTSCQSEPQVRASHKKFEQHGIIISKPKMQLFQTTIEFLGVVIGKGQIVLQPHRSEKNLKFSR